MSTLDETQVSLRFFGDDLDPDDITRLLGAAPTESCRKGDILPLWPDRTRIAKEGSWRLRAPARVPGDVEAQIFELLSGLTQDMDVWKDLGRRYQPDVFCGLFMATGSDEFTLSNAVLDALSRRGLRLRLDLYDHVEE